MVRYASEVSVAVWRDGAGYDGRQADASGGHYLEAVLGAGRDGRLVRERSQARREGPAGRLEVGIKSARRVFPIARNLPRRKVRNNDAAPLEQCEGP